MCLMIGAAGNEIVRLQLKFYINLNFYNSFTDIVVMKVSDNWNSDGNIYYATVEITYSLDVSYYLRLL